MVGMYNKWWKAAGKCMVAQVWQGGKELNRRQNGQSMVEEPSRMGLHVVCVQQVCVCKVCGVVCARCAVCGGGVDR